MITKVYGWFIVLSLIKSYLTYMPDFFFFSLFLLFTATHVLSPFSPFLLIKATHALWMGKISLVEEYMGIEYVFLMKINRVSPIKIKLCIAGTELGSFPWGLGTNSYASHSKFGKQCICIIYYLFKALGHVTSASITLSEILGHHHSSFFRLWMLLLSWISFFIYRPQKSHVNRFTSSPTVPPATFLVFAT